MTKREVFVLVLILALAAGFRLYALDRIPPGLSVAEAVSGNKAAAALESGHADDLFTGMQAVSIHFFGHTARALRVPAALVGILTILGTYLLARRLFSNWELAALAAFLMTVGIWHVTFSRIGLGIILVPLFAVWGLYYLYSALTTHRLWDWALAGIAFGVGMGANATFRLMPLVIIVVLVGYLLSLRGDFSHDKYLHTRHQLWGGMALMVSVILVIFIPMLPALYASPGTTWSTEHVGPNALHTFTMFLTDGDSDWGHGIAGQPVLYFPIAALFAVGLIRSILKIGRMIRTHGHPSVVHLLLLSWFIVGLIPAILSPSAPNAILALVVAPAVYIMAAEGLWWLFTWARHWYGQRDVHMVCLPGPHGHHYCAGEGTIVVTIALVALLAALGTVEASRYFVDWAGETHVATAFSGRSTDIAARLNDLPPAALKYIVTSENPGLAQPIMFLTDSATPAGQKRHNIYYLTMDQFKRGQYTRGALVIQLEP